MAATSPAQQVLKRKLAGDNDTPGDVSEARLVVIAVQGLDRPLAVSPAKLRPLLLWCCELIEAGADSFAKTALRKAVVRPDELTA